LFAGRPIPGGKIDERGIEGEELGFQFVVMRREILHRSGQAGERGGASFHPA